MIALQNVSFAYGQAPVLECFSLRVVGGQAVCLFGASGCGKTTAMRLVCGLETPIAGSVAAPERLSVVFQENRLMRHKTVLGNLLLVKSGAESEALALLAALGLEGLERKRVSDLSGGQARRVAIARALLFDGEALVMDEGFTGLDAENKAKAAALITERFLQKGKPVLMVSHEKEDAVLLSAEILPL